MHLKKKKTSGISLNVQKVTFKNYLKPSHLIKDFNGSKTRSWTSYMDNVG